MSRARGLPRRRPARRLLESPTDSSGSLAGGWSNQGSRRHGGHRWVAVEGMDSSRGGSRLHG
jgi:hypothetical protein